MKRTLKILLVLGVVVCLGSIDGEMPGLSSKAMADTCMVGGPISTNTTWSTADCDTYVVYGNILVEPGVTLTIMPGVVVAFQETYRLEVRGALTARGTASDSIVFTSWPSPQNPEWWNYIWYRNSSIDTACSLSYCRIEYATYGVHCDSASPTISHCRIRKCYTGIYCYNASPEIAQSNIADNEGSPYGSGIYIRGGSPATFGNVIERNTYRGISVDPSGHPTSVLITADTIRENHKHGINLYYGGISAIIRSCDIYLNPERGGIWARLSSNTNVRITNCHIHNNTSTWTGGGAIYVEGGFVVIDSNCINDNWTTVSGNTAGGIYFEDVDSARVQYNDICGNSGPTKYAYEVYSGEPSSPDIHGEYNWWGTSDSVAISQLVYDYYDNVDLRKFVFAPFADSSYPYWWRGDANGDGDINSADIVCLINYLFKFGPDPVPWEAGDVNCDGDINSADVVYLINYLFKGGPSPGCCP